MDTWKQVISTNKLFAYTFLAMLAAQLVRIPLGNFGEASPLDTIAHVVLPAVGTPLLVMYLVLKGYVQISSARFFILYAVCLAISLESLWEVFEFGVDAVFQAGWQPSNHDTMLDVISALIGGAAGAILFTRLNKEIFADN